MRSLVRRLGRTGWALAFVALVVGVLYAQRPFRQYPSVEGWEQMPLPSDWKRSAEWTFARLMYPPGPLDGYRGRFDGDWRGGGLFLSRRHSGGGVQSARGEG